MPGFVGIVGNSVQNRLDEVSKALALTVYASDVVTEQLASTHQLILTKSYFSFQDHAATKTAELSCWVEGDVFDFPIINNKIQSIFSAQLLDSYQQNEMVGFLKKCDGVFIAIIFDPQHDKLLIITDRFGLRPFYVSEQASHLLMASEVKCFPSFKTFTVKIIKEQIESFIEFGHLMGENTWFETVELVKPASVYTYSLSKSTLDQTYYWRWNEIKRGGQISLNEAAEMVAPLLQNAIQSRAKTSAKLGVLLSGGLDSRAIVAALYKKYSFTTLTFGNAESKDVKLAARVARKANVPNMQYPVYHKNWLQNRFAGVWKTDGMLNLLHMHYSHIMPDVRKHMALNLSGFLGDVVLGGSYLTKKKKTFLNTRINSDIAAYYYGQSSRLTNPHDSFFDIDCIDPYLQYNRGRRMIGMGAEEPNKTIAQRMPFFEIKLMEALYLLPDEYRLHNAVYEKALLRNYPDFFSNIPDATSGVSLSESPSLYSRAKGYAYHKLIIAKTLIGMPTSFTDYNRWLREPLTVDLLRSLLNPSTALYPHYIQQNFIDLYVEPHVKRKGYYATEILAALTIEIWLQQIFNGNHLPHQYVK